MQLPTCEVDPSLEERHRVIMPGLRKVSHVFPHIGIRQKPAANKTSYLSWRLLHSNLYLQMSFPVFLPAPKVLWGSIPPKMMTDSRSGRNNDVSDMYSFCDPNMLMLITFLETVGSYCGYVMHGRSIWMPMRGFAFAEIL